jgi:hypothetical protein
MPVAENPRSLGHFERISAHASNQVTWVAITARHGNEQAHRDMSGFEALGEFHGGADQAISDYRRGPEPLCP